MITVAWRRLSEAPRSALMADHHDLCRVLGGEPVGMLEHRPAMATASAEGLPTEWPWTRALGPRSERSRHAAVHASCLTLPSCQPALTYRENYG